MIYQYQALDRTGKTVADYIDAPSEQAARQKIRSQGLYLVKMEKHEMDDKKPTAKAGGGSKSTILAALEEFSNNLSLRMSGKSLGLFSRQLATLLKAGLPLPTAITDIIEQIDNKQFRNIIADIKEKLEEGSSFSNALARHRVVFSDMYINMVRVGESLGSLDQVIERLAETLEKRNILKSKVQSALWYPAFMFSFAIIVVIFLLVNIIPRIAMMYTDMNREMPVPTKIVIGISNVLAYTWFLIPLAIGLLFVVYNRFVAKKEGRQKIDEIKLKIPLFKVLYNKLIVHRFTENLGILLNNRVDIIKSFEIVEKIVGNVVIESKISDAAKMIREGSTVTNALRKVDFLPKLVIGMIAAGEQSDRLDDMLLNIGRVYETEIDLNVTSLMNLLEPAIIVAMGVIVGGIFISVMLPLMSMNSLVQ